MQEQSHLDDMRAALRGERVRAEEAKRRTLENVLAGLAQPPAQAEAESEAPQRPRRFRLFGRR